MTAFDSEPLALDAAARIQRAVIAELERAVIDAALAWDVLYKARPEQWPEDDNLHFTVERLLAARRLPIVEPPSTA